MQRPLEKIQLIRRSEVEQRTGLSRSAIYALAKEGAFPRPVALSDRSVAWVEGEVSDWIEQRIIERGCAYQDDRAQ